MPRAALITPPWAIRIVFGVNGAALGVWFPRIPDVKAALQVDLFTLSMCFFMLPLGTMIGFAIAQAVIARLGPRQTCIVAGPVFVLGILLPAFAPQVVLLGAALFVVGLMVGSIEVAMNTMAGIYEKQAKRRIMTSCHAFWSFGGMLGALTAGGFAQAGISFPVQQVILTPPLAALAWYAATALGPEGERVPSPKKVFTLPTAGLIGLCVMPMGALLLEGAMMEWSALLLRDDLLVAPFTAAAIYAAFAVAMALARLMGDPLASRFGAPRIIAVSAILAGLGAAGFGAATGPATAMIAGVTLGIGIANIYPLAMSLATQAPGASEQNIAAVAFTAFTAFLVGPPLIGTLGSFIGLPATFIVLAPVGLYPLLMLQVPRRLSLSES